MRSRRNGFTKAALKNDLCSADMSMMLFLKHHDRPLPRVLGTRRVITGQRNEMIFRTKEGFIPLQRNNLERKTLFSSVLPLLKTAS